MFKAKLYYSIFINCYNIKQEGPKPSVWKKDYDKTRRFRDEWLERFPWVRKDPDDENSRFGYCPYCKIKLEPKAKRLEDHEHTVKHIKNIGGKVSGKIRAFGKKKKKLAGRRGRVRKVSKCHFNDELMLMSIKIFPYICAKQMSQ